MHFSSVTEKDQRQDQDLVPAYSSYFLVPSLLQPLSSPSPLQLLVLSGPIELQPLSGPSLLWPLSGPSLAFSDWPLSGPSTFWPPIGLRLGASRAPLSLHLQLRSHAQTMHEGYYPSVEVSSEGDYPSVETKSRTSASVFEPISLNSRGDVAYGRRNQLFWKRAGFDQRPHFPGLAGLTLPGRLCQLSGCARLPCCL